jgi:uncharacterized protein
MRRWTFVLVVVLATVVTGAWQGPAVQRAPAAASGVAAKKPVFAAACRICPWGAVGDVVKEALKSYGYDLQICSTCNGVRYVSEPQLGRSIEEALKDTPYIPISQRHPMPSTPPDMGAVSTQALGRAYQGTSSQPGAKQLRLIANIQSPNYLIVAAKSELGLKDLGEIRSKKWPVRIVTGGEGLRVLEYYGLTRQAIESAGGAILGTINPEDRRNFDVVIHGGTLATAPEFSLWYELSQKYDLTYLQLPDDLLDRLTADTDYERGTIPNGLLRGIDRPIPTLVRTGHSVFARTDLPDDFAYTLAKALDEQQALWQWSNLNLSYNFRTVAKAYDVPLHPGAARYYRERGYLNPSRSSQTPRTTLTRPILAAACKICPWGGLGEVVRQALSFYGVDVMICANCARGENPRLVAGAKPTPPFDVVDYIPVAQRPAPPQGSIDFGVTSADNVWSAYHGNRGFSGDGPRPNLRLIANIQSPSYLIVAVKADLGITDLRQLREKRWPVRILTGAAGDVETILGYYGLSQKMITDSGGHIGNGSLSDERKNFDLVIAGGSLGNAPEYNVWYEVSQRYDLRYLQLPDDLLTKLVSDTGSRGFIPNGLLRGIDHQIPTVVRTGTVIYGRDDTPDDFAYVVAKAIDERQDLLQWSHLTFSYNARTVWKALDIPLHPGAARYYRERGYMK